MALLRGLRPLGPPRRWAHNGPSYETLEVQRLCGADAGVVVLGLRRPEARNALSRRLVAELGDAVGRVGRDSGARVVVLRSLVPGVFCAGADLKERLGMSEEETRQFVPTLRRLAGSIEGLAPPVIAAMDGAALGGGLEFALACDLRVCSADARLGLVETRLGIFPGAGGTQRLPRLVGPALAKELIFTARVFDGREAWRMGLVNHAVEQSAGGDAAYERALELAREILPNGPAGVRLAKFAVDKGLGADPGTGGALEEACYAQLLNTRDRLEGLRAFREKRAPVYTGE
ncbi:methylglutaconyl-CoA hydratase, mitochondrial [Bacillus rossius redtenbacheri]|uniref:methylglutaconyl-CoA hydratase, mitochondrial n=1 Tax=Bacillus rossius redtenbacheri TaxID=93214 RepID=UPI002FDDE4C4